RGPLAASPRFRGGMLRRPRPRRPAAGVKTGRAARGRARPLHLCPVPQRPPEMVTVLLDDALETVPLTHPTPRDFTPRPPIPRATYRLQFNHSFTFADAARVVSYLHALGVSDCYSSPYFKACPGSPHGYDVIDHSTLNPELGSDEDYAAFTAE